MIERIKGTVVFKCLPEDFIVEEIGLEEKYESRISSSSDVFTSPRVDFGNLNLTDRRTFLVCDFEKIGIDHFTAMATLGKELGLASHQIGYAGTKDKKAWTCQRISLFDPSLEKIANFKVPGMVLKNFKWAKHKLKIGDLRGNRFTVVLRDADNDALKILSRMRTTSEIPNFFGMQRFGSLRKDNVLIGKFILKRKFEDAVFAFLTGVGESEDVAVREAKKRLKNERDLSAARTYFPEELHVECRILDYLSAYPGDWIGALKLLDEKVLVMMCQSVQSQIFNEVLERALDEETPIAHNTFPLLGNNGGFSIGRIGKLQELVLASHGLSLSDFSVPEFPVIDLKKSTRKALFTVSDLEIETEEDELFMPSKKVLLKFVLDSGVYASTYLENFFTLRISV